MCRSSDDDLDAVEIFVEAQVNLFPGGEIDFFLAELFANALALGSGSIPTNVLDALARRRGEGERQIAVATPHAQCHWIRAPANV